MQRERRASLIRFPLLFSITLSWSIRTAIPATEPEKKTSFLLFVSKKQTKYPVKKIRQNPNVYTVFCWVSESNKERRKSWSVHVNPAGRKRAHSWKWEKRSFKTSCFHWDFESTWPLQKEINSLCDLHQNFSCVSVGLISRHRYVRLACHHPN